MKHHMYDANREKAKEAGNRLVILRDVSPLPSIRQADVSTHYYSINQMSSQAVYFQSYFFVAFCMFLFFIRPLFFEKGCRRQPSQWIFGTYSNAEDEVVDISANLVAVQNDWRQRNLPGSGLPSSRCRAHQDRMGEVIQFVGNGTLDATLFPFSWMLNYWAGLMRGTPQRSKSKSKKEESNVIGNSAKKIIIIKLIWHKISKSQKN